MVKRGRARAAGRGIRSEESRLSAPSMIVKCLACVGAGAAGVMLPASAASASTISSNTSSSAVAGTSLSITPATCATVADQEGLIGTWGIGAKATDVLPNAATCAQDVQSVTPSTPVAAAINQLTKVESSNYWLNGGAYPTSAALFTVSSGLTFSASALDRQVQLAPSSPSSVDLVSAEQWIAYSAYSIDTHYLNDLNPATPLGSLAGQAVQNWLSAGTQAYGRGQYVQATQYFLAPLTFAYAVAPPFSYCDPYCGLG